MVAYALLTQQLCTSRFEVTGPKTIQDLLDWYEDEHEIEVSCVGVRVYLFMLFHTVVGWRLGFNDIVRPVVVVGDVCQIGWRTTQNADRRRL